MASPLRISSLDDIPFKHCVPYRKSLMSSGRYGMVYRVEKTRGAPHIAVKQLRKVRQDLDATKYIDCITHEVNNLGELHAHNSKARYHVIQLYDVYQDEDHVYMELEHCKHGSLQEWLMQDDNLEYLKERPKAYNSILRQTLNALAECHRTHISHGDVKPCNVLMTDLGRLKLCDFGQSRSKMERTTGCYHKQGTPWYASPEIYIGESGTAADIWSFGVMAFEIRYGGLHPFLADVQPESPQQLREAITRQHIKWPIHDPPSLDFVEFITQCLHRDASKRWTAQDALESSFLVKKTR